MSERTDDLVIQDLPLEESLTAEEKERLAGAGRFSFRPTFEDLEAREMMDAAFFNAVTASLAQPATGTQPGNVRP